MSATEYREWFQSTLKELGMNEAEYRAYLQTPAGQQWREQHRMKGLARSRWWYRVLHPDTFRPCTDCGVNTIWLGESYMVRKDVWDQAWLGAAPQTRMERRILCIGCLEARIGRRLSVDDFYPVPINDPDDPRMALVPVSDRLRNRLRARSVLYLQVGGVRC